ncbi:MAG: tetratricopeptide repeat protein [bacterium]|nr:tetratricopeptide repeat protein [bacterium]
MKLTICAAAILIVITVSSHAADPSDAAIALVNASIMLEKQGDYAESLKKMEAAALEIADDYVIQLRLGWIRYMNAEYNLSEAAYRKAIELSQRKSVEALLGLTYPLAALGEWSQVESTYLQILDLDPNHFEANLYLGQLLSNRGDAARARVYLKTAHSLYPSNYSVNLSLGWVFVSTGEITAARECFTRAIMLSPADSSATRGLGLVR